MSPFANVFSKRLLIHKFCPKLKEIKVYVPNVEQKLSFISRYCSTSRDNNSNTSLLLPRKRKDSISFPVDHTIDILLKSKSVCSRLEWNPNTTSSNRIITTHNRVFSIHPPLSNLPSSNTSQNGGYWICYDSFNNPTLKIQLPPVIPPPLCPSMPFSSYIEQLIQGPPSAPPPNLPPDMQAQRQKQLDLESNHWPLSFESLARRHLQGMGALDPSFARAKRDAVKSERDDGEGGEERREMKLDLRGEKGEMERRVEERNRENENDMSRMIRNQMKEDNERLAIQINKNSSSKHPKGGGGNAYYTALSATAQAYLQYSFDWIRGSVSLPQQTLPCSDSGSSLGQSRIGLHLICMLSYEKVALAVWENGRLRRHKVLTGYTVRRCGGGSQERHDREDGRARGPGATLRREETRRLWRAVRQELYDWRDDIARCMLLFRSGDVRCWNLIFEEGRPVVPMERHDPRWRDLSVTVGPGYDEMIQIYRYCLCSGRIDRIVHFNNTSLKE